MGLIGFEDDSVKEWHGQGGGSYRAGWPMHMFSSDVNAFLGSTPSWPDKHGLRAFELPARELVRRGYPTDRLPRWLHAYGGRRIPIEPLWSGLIVNIAFWTLVIWWAERAWCWAVRVSRARPGACTACGYDLAGLSRRAISQCPECGNPLKRSHPAPTITSPRD